MATTFLTLVNDTLRRMNEVIISSTDFPTVIGHRAQVKDAVNAALHDISQKQFEFPFNHTDGSLTLVAGTKAYALASDCKIADWGSFRINYDASNSWDARPLVQINYDAYLKRFFSRDAEATTGDYDTPNFVYRKPDGTAGFTAVTDQAYGVSYDYYSYHTDLALHSDTMAVPDAFKHVVVDGATYYSYMFRDNSQQASIMERKFTEGISRMRTILTNDTTDVRDTRVGRLINTPHGNY